MNLDSSKVVTTATAALLAFCSYQLVQNTQKIWDYGHEIKFLDYRVTKTEKELEKK